MEFGELKLNLQTLIGCQKFMTTWIDLKFSLDKQVDNAQLSQQILLNLNIVGKLYSILKIV